MIEKAATLILVIILAFLAGWYSATHTDRFFSWLGGVGTYWQKQVNKDCNPPPNYVCTKTTSVP